MTIATLLFTCLIFLLIGWTGNTHYVTALSVGAIVCIAASNGGTTSQDLKTGFLIGSTPRLQQIAILFGAFASALVLGPILLVLNQAKTVYVPIEQVAPAGLSTNAAALTVHEHLAGAQASSDQREYLSWQKTDDIGGPAGKYLVDPSSGKAAWLVDPGINGTFTTRPDGSKVEKFSAPKAVLVSYIIKGILDRKTAVGAGSLWGDDRGRAGDVGHPGTGVRGRGLPAAVFFHADLRRRHDPLAGRRAATAAFSGCAACQ